MSTDPRLVALLGALTDFEPRLLQGGGGLRCALDDAELVIRCEASEPPTIEYSADLSPGHLTNLRSQLDPGLDARLERTAAGRFGLVVEPKDDVSTADDLLRWTLATIDQLQRARTVADGEASQRTSSDEDRREASRGPDAAGTDAVERPLPLRHIERPELRFEPDDWAGLESPVAVRVAQKSAEALNTYRSDRLLVDEHANKELGTAQGGYGRRQIYELVQNAADELQEQPGGTIKLLLTEEALYCANEGAPVSIEGVNALLMSDLSVKRGAEIGRFGLGFKSVLAITKRPLFVSRSGSFRFDPEAAESADQADRARRGSRALSAHGDRGRPRRRVSEDDEALRELMPWATTVVKLPRDEPAAHDWLRDDLARFPAEFLLFSPHVGPGGDRGSDRGRLSRDLRRGRRRRLDAHRGRPHHRLVGIPGRPSSLR